MNCEWSNKIFNVTESSFEPLAIEIFRYQFDQNLVYRSFVTALGKNSKTVKIIKDIPFLPVSFFKTQEIRTGDFKPQIVFKSSGTIGSINSNHYVKDLLLYEESFLKTFECFYGKISEYCVLALLPSYIERENSSLVFMVDKMIKKSNHLKSGFYKGETDSLIEVLNKLNEKKQKTILIGVTFALIDLAEKFSTPLTQIIIMETGGMKGRREEMTREAVHEIIKKSFSVPVVHSEYGMTELMSQAYSKSNGIFQCPPWMKIVLRDEEDPFQIKSSGKGIINIIDLANVHSCSFLASDDVGKLYDNGSFEVLGRMDGSDLRGCSLMVI